MNNHSNESNSGPNYSKHTIRSTISLRIFGKELDLEEMTNMLGREPTRIRKKGELAVNEKGEATYDLVGWHLGSETNDKEDIEDKIRNLLNSLNADLDIWKAIVEKNRVDIFCGLFLDKADMGFGLSPDVIKMLAYRRISIGFDIYSYSPLPSEVDNPKR